MSRLIIHCVQLLNDTFCFEVFLIDHWEVNVKTPQAYVSMERPTSTAITGLLKVTTVAFVHLDTITTWLHSPVQPWSHWAQRVWTPTNVL